MYVRVEGTANTCEVNPKNNSIEHCGKGATSCSVYRSFSAHDHLHRSPRFQHGSARRILKKLTLSAMPACLSAATASRNLSPVLQRSVHRALAPKRAVVVRAEFSRRSLLLSSGVAAAAGGAGRPVVMASSAEPMEVEGKAEAAAPAEPRVGKDIPRAELAPGLEISRVVKVRCGAGSLPGASSRATVDRARPHRHPASLLGPRCMLTCFP